MNLICSPLSIVGLLQVVGPQVPGLACSFLLPNQASQEASMTCDVRTGGREGETIKQAILVKILVLSNKTNEAPHGQLDMSMAVACRSPPSDPSTSTNY